jgi:hypothetical protein
VNYVLSKHHEGNWEQRYSSAHAQLQLTKILCCHASQKCYLFIHLFNNDLSDIKSRMTGCLWILNLVDCGIGRGLFWHKLSRYNDGLHGRGIWVRFPVGARYFSLLPSVQTGFGPHPVSYPMDTGASFPEAGRKADHSRPPRAEAKNGAAMTPLPHMSSWRGASLIKHRENFTFTISSFVWMDLRKPDQYSNRGCFEYKTASHYTPALGIWLLKVNKVKLYLCLIN